MRSRAKHGFKRRRTAVNEEYITESTNLWAEENISVVPRIISLVGKIKSLVGKNMSLIVKRPSNRISRTRGERRP